METKALFQTSIHCIQLHFKQSHNTPVTSDTWYEFLNSNITISHIYNDTLHIVVSIPSTPKILLKAMMSQNISHLDKMDIARSESWFQCCLLKVRQNQGPLLLADIVSYGDQMQTKIHYCSAVI